jgi:hypothetical protein
MTCVMSLACWKAIGQPIQSPSPTLLMYFDGRSFRPHGIIPSFPMQLGGKTMCVEIEVVDALLNYNLLLGRSCTYAMHAVVATVFQVLLFSHEGRIVTLYIWVDYSTKIFHASTSFIIFFKQGGIFMDIAMKVHRNINKNLNLT